MSEHGEMEEVKERSCESKEHYRIPSKGYEREECVHGGKERPNE